MTASEFKKELGSLHGAYLFFGEEEYLKHFYLCEVREKTVGDPSLDLFNRVRIDGYGNIDSLPSALAMPPMMADKKLIEIHGISYADLSEAQTDDLCAMLDGANEDESAVVILYALPSECEVQNFKKPPAFFKALGEHAKTVYFEYQSPSKLVPWLIKHFNGQKITAEADVCNFLIQRASRDMTALANEVDKLCAYLAAHGRDRLAREDIEFVCCHIDEIDAFDFANAILSGNRERAYVILKDMFAKKEKPPVILGSIASVYIDLYRIATLREAGANSSDISKKLHMHEYRVGLYMRAAGSRSPQSIKRAVRECAAADIKLKTTPLSPFGVLSALVSSL